VDCGLILGKGRGLFARVAGISRIFDLFLKGKIGGLGSPLVDHWGHWVTVNRGHGHGRELIRAPTRGRHGPRELTTG
jgi:hypothetical protein